MGPLLLSDPEHLHTNGQAIATPLPIQFGGLVAPVGSRVGALHISATHLPLHQPTLSQACYQPNRPTEFVSPFLPWG